MVLMLAAILIKVASHCDGRFNDLMGANVAVGIKFNDSIVGIKCRLAGL